MKAFFTKNQVFAKIASVGFISSLSRATANLVVSKVLAISLGSLGIAIYSQLVNYSAILSTFSTGATTTGVVKLTSENSSNKKYQHHLSSTVFKLSFFLSIIITLLCLFFAPFVSKVVFGDGNFVNVVRVLGIANFFTALNAICISFLNGYGKYKLYLIYQLLINLSLLILVLASIYFTNHLSALYAYLSVNIVAFVLMVRKLSNEKIIKREYYLNSVFNYSILKSLGSFTLMSFSAVLFVNLSQVIIRTFIINSYDKETAGLWDAMLRISSTYFSFIVSSLSVYYLPRIASIFEKHEIKNEAINIIKTLAPLVISGFALMYLLREYIIRILYTSEFIIISDHFLPVFAGDLFKWIGWVFSYILIAKSQVKIYFINETTMFIITILLTICGGHYMGFSGLFYGYLLSYFIYMITSYILCNVYLARIVSTK